MWNNFFPQFLLGLYSTYLTAKRAANHFFRKRKAVMGVGTLKFPTKLVLFRGYFFFSRLFCICFTRMWHRNHAYTAPSSRKGKVWLLFLVCPVSTQQRFAFTPRSHFSLTSLLSRRKYSPVFSGWKVLTLSQSYENSLTWLVHFFKDFVYEWDTTGFDQFKH